MTFASVNYSYARQKENINPAANASVSYTTPSTGGHESLALRWPKLAEGEYATAIESDIKALWEEEWRKLHDEVCGRQNREHPC
jgi:hypothetical protein